MTKEQELQLLRQDNRHYLWNKPRAKWTTEDLHNLENGIKTRPKTTQIKMSKQAVLYVKRGEMPVKFESVVEASKQTSINDQTIYAILNGRKEQLSEQHFYKV